MREICIGILSLGQGQHLIASLNRAALAVANFLVGLGIGDDDWRGQVVALGLDGVQVKLDQWLADLDFLVLGDQDQEAFAVEFNRVHADVDQDFRAVLALQTDSVASWEDQADRAL